MIDTNVVRKQINEIFNSSDKIDQINSISEITNKRNNYKALVGSIFVDIRRSTQLFKKEEKRVVKILKAFHTVILNILSSSDCLKESGTRGDCSYGIYVIDKNNKDYYIENLFEKAFDIYEFLNILNEELGKKGWSKIKAGIGIGLYEDVIFNMKSTNVNRNEIIWLGRAVVDGSNACNNSNDCRKYGIVISKNLYETIKAMDNSELNKIIPKFRKASSTDDRFYGIKCDVLDEMLED